jgi:spore coat protein U-like protein
MRRQWPAMAALLVHTHAAAAAGCSVNTLGVNFGVYDVFSSQPADISGSITVSCAASTGYSVGISTGFGSYSVRIMTNGQYTLSYNLFTDAARTSIWGDGTGGTATVNATDTGNTYSVYGRVAPRQNVAVGDYNDLVTVTVTY